MKTQRYLLLLMFLSLLTACNSLDDNNLLPIKILGFWGGKAEINSGGTTYEVSNRLFFFPLNIMIVNTQTDDGRIYYDLFTYKFIGKDRVSINGRLIDLLQIKLDQNTIIINSTHGFPPDGRYTKIVSLWLCLLILVIAIFILTTLIKYRNKLRISLHLLNLNN